MMSGICRRIMSATEIGSRQLAAATGNGHRQGRNDRHAFPDTIGGAAVAIGPESGVQQSLDGVRCNSVQRDNVRHALPIRDQWRMGQRRKRGL